MHQKDAQKGGTNRTEITDSHKTRPEMHHPGISVNLRKGSGQDIPFFTIPIRLYRVTNDEDKTRDVWKKHRKKESGQQVLTCFDFAGIISFLSGC